MKKCFVLLLALAVAMPLVASDSFGCGVWFDCPDGIGSKNIDGLALGIPVVANRNLSGASLALCGNVGRHVDGFQGAWIGWNKAESLYGVQLAFVNIQNGQHGDAAVQLGFFNHADKNGVQLGFINNAQDNATFQLGLININKNGLLPVMIFINFGSDLFD